MAILAQQSFFNYETDLSDYGDLERLLMLLEVLPDETLIERLERQRGSRGRDKYPVAVMWNCVLAGIIFQHPTYESLKRELARNAQLRLVVSGGRMTSLTVPPHYAMSRFLKNLMNCQDEIDAMFIAMVDTLSTMLPQFGQDVAIDSKYIKSYAKSLRDKRKAGARAEHDANWGVKEYSGRREDGSFWKKTESFFGFKIHLLVDSNHELPVAYSMTKANRSDMAEAPVLLEHYKACNPMVYYQSKSLQGDRGYDKQGIVEMLANDGIKAVIDTRHLWKEAKKPLLHYDNVLYNEKGEVFCACPKTGKERTMPNNGYESSRDCIRKSCPTAVRIGLYCEGAALCACHHGLRIPRQTDPRAFQRIPRDSHVWQRLYNKRTSVERVNSRLDVSFGFENHTIRGMKKMQLRCSLALLVMNTLAYAHLLCKADSTTYRSLIRIPA